MSERPNRSTNRPGPAARDAETFRSVPASARARKMYPDLIRHREEISLARIFSEAGNSPDRHSISLTAPTGDLVTPDSTLSNRRGIASAHGFLSTPFEKT